MPTMRSWLLAVVLLLSPLGPVACAASGPSSSFGCGSSGVPCLKGTALVEISTSKGSVELSLDGSAAPLTAGNFVDLVRRGAYNGTLFHRVVKEPIPFVVQGGDPQSAKPGTPVDLLGTGSFIDPPPVSLASFLSSYFLKATRGPVTGKSRLAPARRSA